MATKVKTEVRRKREEAEDRQRAHASMSLEARLAKLDKAPGASKKERAKIAQQMAEKKATA